MKKGLDDVRAAFDEPETVSPDPDAVVPEQPDSAPKAAGSSGGDAGYSQPDEVPPLEVEGAKLPLNDTGNAQRLALYFGENLLHVHRVGWFVWNGKFWDLDQDEIQVRAMCHKIQDRIEAELPYLQLSEPEREAVDRITAIDAELRVFDDEKKDLDKDARTKLRVSLNAEMQSLKTKLWGRGSTRQRHLSFAKSSGNSGAIKNMAAEATVALSRNILCLDSDPLRVNTQTGCLRFTVEGGREAGYGKMADVSLEPHARLFEPYLDEQAQYLTKMMPVDYDPDAKCPLFDKFLRRIQPDAEVRAFLQRWFGLSMTGLKVQKFAFFYGDGANGKSVLVDLIARMLDGYAHSAKIESFTGDNRRRGGEATPDIFPLVWARMVRAAEPEEGQRLQEGLIKEITGGEPMLVRLLHQNFLEAHPFFKLTISGNHKPEIRGTDDGIWRRVLLVLFGEKIPEDERDEGLIDKLWEERAGILNWLIKGLLDYLENGLQEPDAITSATDDYRQDSDPVGRFLSTCCVVSGEASDRIDSAELGRALNYWLMLNGHSTWTPNTTGRRLNERAGRYRNAEGNTYERIKSGVSRFSGIHLKVDFKKEFDGAPRDKNGQPVPRTDGSSGYGGGGV